MEEACAFVCAMGEPMRFTLLFLKYSKEYKKRLKDSESFVNESGYMDLFVFLRVILPPVAPVTYNCNQMYNALLTF